MAKLNTAKGTRDFSAEEVQARKFLFGHIKDVYQKYGYSPLETPSVENIETLTGKYGEEGDQLLFRILRSGDFLKKLQKEHLPESSISEIRNAIVDKGLRYDLTIPFARYVAKNHQQIGLPFKRYQLQPVWRADRPAKGRYREFYQCDADVAGSNWLGYDAEFLAIMDDVFHALKLPSTSIRLNNRKILAALAEMLERDDALADMTTAIDKLDKIKWTGVVDELLSRGFSQSDVDKIDDMLSIKGSNNDKLEQLSSLMKDSTEGQTGLQELREVLTYLEAVQFQNAEVVVDFSLARGLSYYTGTIYEAVIKDFAMGTIASGGRYNNLTETFGVSGISGVGMSFGAERIYDVMKELGLFPKEILVGVKALVFDMGEELQAKKFALAQKLRSSGVATDIYPDKAKLGKQFKFAEKRQIEYAVIAGEKEFQNEKFQLKNLRTGEQQALSLSALIEKLN